ncbi:hypothetical protein DTL42_17905 [Bremerella cremea]|uniref:Uncharacterized protein n=1 Tax=Bremerella cremea TaxID=1031537 RepID=A0A368KQ70_9BACT|nr:hypothetical protein DTL42_17905 [Bremerella cremea]
MVDVACVIQLKNDLIAVVNEVPSRVKRSIPVAVELTPNQPVEQVVLVDEATGASKTRARGTVVHREVSLAASATCRIALQKQA